MARKLFAPSQSSLLNEEENRKDLGFGQRITDRQSRLINRDGTFNVERRGQSFLNSINWYHRLVTIHWWQFFGCIFLVYLLLNSLFALIYLLIGIEQLQGVEVDSYPVHGAFWEAFFFSAQTLTTVGYGRVSPLGFWSNSVASIEALMGLLMFVIATGLLYGRFSRPLPRIRFSKTALISPYLDINGFMFRIIHERDNELIDLEAELSLSRLEVLPNGQRVRKYYTLELERNHVNFFPLNWTIVHPITSKSPLSGATPDSLMESDTEILVLLRAMDETFMQQVHTRYSYRYEEIVWGAKFEPMFNSATTGKVVVHVEEIDNTRPASLNS
ncbi:ion channel [Telluribacter sp.]|jgi:inward rectifier potassium channel|uniref:ion channel n=1 Tax=Telluribacter sp. TaxID=1978767 RepID=UPI002E0DE387|nr:ion channel [Telluribacter sp.]